MPRRPYQFKSLSLSLSLSAGAGRDRAKSETGLSSPVLDQQRSSSCFPVCFVGFPIAHLSFVCLSHGGGSLAQSWPSNSGQVTDDGSRNSLPSNSSHPRAFSQCLNNRISKLAHRRSQPLHWTSHRLDRFSTSLLGTTGKDAMGQYQPAGNNETPLAGDDLNSNVIVNAQLTHVISRDDALQGQDASNVSDVRCQTYRQCMTLLYQDASLEDDAANGASVHNLPQVNASVLPATCVECDSLMVKRVCNSGVTVKRIITTYMHIVSMEGSVMIMNCSQNKPQIRMKLMRSPANGTPSPEQRRIQKYFSLALRIWIKPQQRRHLMMSETFLDVKSLFAWMKRSWTSSGLNTSHGTASKTYVARRMSNLPRGSGLRCSKLNMPFSGPSFTTTPPLWRQSQLGKRWCSAAGSFWDDLQSTPLRATAHTFWMRDWSSFGLRIGLLSGPWYVLNVMLLQCRTRRAERTSSRCSHVFAKSLHWRVLVKKDEPQQLPEMHQQFQSQNRLSKRSRAFTQRTQNHQLQCQPCSCLKWLGMSLSHSERCHDSVNQDHLACARNIGMTSALWRVTATCLCKYLRI